MQLPSIDCEVPWGYFDGASQGGSATRGDGAVPFMDSSFYFHLKYAAGEGTNNRVELYALWILLKCAKEKGLHKLQVLGDSKLVIN